MAYTKTTWVNGSAPPLSAENLNKIEDGIYNAHAELTSQDARLDALENYAVVEAGTSGGWAYKKYADGTMVAEKDCTTSSPSWSQVGSSGIYSNPTALTPPTGMTVKCGFASLTQNSAYIFGSQIQTGADVRMQLHRLTGTDATFTCHVMLIGTYS